ncbi:chemotaxis protein CheB [Adhaeribacter terreus]|uniref:protein-glutamate methylesterase n=1 Tax=Adhaeribacter terreus TaxID=529703 RepID=A0ABW0EC60_9BACT
MKYEAIVIGTSAGGLLALTTLLEALPADFPLPIIVVQHRSKDERNLLEELLSQKCKIAIKQADEKEKIEKGVVYFAPPDYHLLIERDQTFSLSYDTKVNYSRPAIDILFETAAFVYKQHLLAIILTGANADGANGIKTIRKTGGTTIAQNPASAQFPAMPQAAIDTGCIDKILELTEIKDLLIGLGKR